MGTSSLATKSYVVYKSTRARCSTSNNEVCKGGASERSWRS